MKKPRWIDKRALLLLHEESLALFGGSRGTRDEGLLDSALARPLNLNTYEEGSTIAELAACYGFGIAKNHAFVDGNKRAAYLAIKLFLRLNGFELNASAVGAITTMLALAAGDLDEAGLAAWVTRHTVRIVRFKKK